MSLVQSRYGTMRGLVRLTLAHGEVALGRSGVAQPAAAKVRRLVFVCRGNICRSAFADALAAQEGLRAISLGLSTDAGRPAHPPAIAAAEEFGVDLNHHRAARIEDYVPHDGDLLLAMETRQLRQLAANPRLSAVPRTLLGLYATPSTPHIHDPYGLNEAYMRNCFRRIASAVDALKRRFPGASIS